VNRLASRAARSFLAALGTLAAACTSFDRVESWDADEVRGRPERRLEIRFDPGREVFACAVEPGTLTAEVLRVVNDAVARRIETTIRFENHSDHLLRIDIGSVFLRIGASRVGVKLPRDMAWPPFRPRVRQDVNLSFDLAQAVTAQVLALEFASVQPHGVSLTVRLKVPGFRSE
jgi:hypothetical protein